MIRAGQISAFYLFDVAESVALDRLPALLGPGTAPVRLAPKPAIPSYVRYQTPPLQIEGGLLGHEDVDGFRVRVKVFDYGVVSVSLSRPFAGSWTSSSTSRITARSTTRSKAAPSGCAARWSAG